MSTDGDLIERFEADPYADHLNMTLVEVRPGYARAEMDAAEELANFQGYIQGGALVSLADYAFAAAANSHGVGALALTLSFNFVAVVRPGPRLSAEATEEKLGRRTGLYKLEIKQANGTLIASGQGLAYRQDPAPAG